MPGMLRQFLGLRPNANRAVADAVYSRIVAAARQPEFYANWDVPDTPLGRFEMLSLHVFLFMHRARGGDQALGDLTQELTDGFFTDVDHSLRELGIGDLGVPKRMKKLARMFYGRAEAYGAALQAGDVSALAAAFQRNIRPDLAEWNGAGPLSHYAMEVERSLAAQTSEQLLQGRVEFPSPVR